MSASLWPPTRKDLQPYCSGVRMIDRPSTLCSHASLRHRGAIFYLHNAFSIFIFDVVPQIQTPTTTAIAQFLYNRSEIDGSSRTVPPDARHLMQWAVKYRTRHVNLLVSRTTTLRLIQRPQRWEGKFYRCRQCLEFGALRGVGCLDHWRCRKPKLI